MARQEKGHATACPFSCGISARIPTVRPSFDGQSLMDKDIVATLLRRCVPYGLPTVATADVMARQVWTGN